MRPQGWALRPGDPRPGAAAAIARSASRGPCGGRGGEPGGRPARALLRCSAPGLLRPSPAGPAARPGTGPRRRPLCFGPAPANARWAREGARGARESEPAWGPGTGLAARIRGPGPGPGPGARLERHCAAAPGGLRSLGPVPRLAGRRAELGALSHSRPAGSVPVPGLGGRRGAGWGWARSFRRSRNRAGSPEPCATCGTCPPARRAVADKPQGGGSRGAGGGLRAGGLRRLTRALGALPEVIGRSVCGGKGLDS